MSTEELLVERDGPTLLVSINREGRPNSLGEDVHAALPETWQRVHRGNSIRAIVITGSRTRAFCTKMDLKENTMVDTGSIRGAPPSGTGSR